MYLNWIFLKLIAKMSFMDCKRYQKIGGKLYISYWTSWLFANIPSLNAFCVSGLHNFRCSRPSLQRQLMIARWPALSNIFPLGEDACARLLHNPAQDPALCRNVPQWLPRPMSHRVIDQLLKCALISHRHIYQKNSTTSRSNIEATLPSNPDQNVVFIQP